MKTGSRASVKPEVKGKKKKEAEGDRKNQLSGQRKRNWSGESTDGKEMKKTKRTQAFSLELSLQNRPMRRRVRRRNIGIETGIMTTL
jgi:hypothetical protein